MDRSNQLWQTPGLSSHSGLDPRFAASDASVETMRWSEVLPCAVLFAKRESSRGVKFEDFATNGVAEYWIVDAEAEIVEQYFLEEGTYKLALKSGSGKLACRVIPNLVLPIEAIFDEQKNVAAVRDLLG